MRHLHTATASLLLLFLLAGCGGGDTEAPAPASASSEQTASDSRTHLLQSRMASSSADFEDDMSVADTTRWWAAHWSNGGYFANGWHPDQITFADGRMDIALQADTRQLTDGRVAVSGEWRTTARYGYGTFSTRLKASGTPGTISAFFLYTGPYEGTRHDEIDIEIKGDDPTKLSINYWTDGVEHPTLIDLGFDASAGYHDYAFRWTASALQWFVDGRLVHEERGLRGPLPEVPGYLMLNLWGATGAEPWSSSYQASTILSRMSVDRAGYVQAPVALSQALRISLRPTAELEKGAPQ